MEHKPPVRYIPAAFACGLGLLLTFTVCVLWQRYDSQVRVQAEFKQHASTLAEALQKEFAHFFTTLDTVRALYASSSEVERKEFQIFVRQLLQQHHAIHALAWIPRVSAAQRTAFEETAQAETSASFRFTECSSTGQMVRSSEYPEYWPLYFVEPALPPLESPGLNFASEPGWHTLLTKTRDTGELTITPPLLCDQKKEPSAYLYAFLPIYRNNLPRETLAERRANFQGFSLLVLHIDHAIQEALKGYDRSGLILTITDNTADAGEWFLYREAPPAAAAGYRWEDTLSVADRRWRFVVSFFPNTAVLTQRTLFPMAMILCTGLTLTALLTAYLFTTASDKIRLMQSAQALGKSEARLTAVITSAMDAIIILDNERRITLFNAAAERMFHCPASEVIGQTIDRFVPEHLRSVHHEHMRRFETTGKTTRVMGALGAVSGVRTSGDVFPIEASISQIEAAGQRLYTVILRDITEQQKTGQVLREQTLLANLETEVGRAIIQSNSQAEMLAWCAKAMLQRLEASCIRIWACKSGSNVLELQASVGMCTPDDESHASIPVGQGSIGLIAQEQHPYVTSAVMSDPRLADQEWARRAGIVSFAGYPLMVGDRLFGVIAMFAAYPLSDFVLQALRNLTSFIAFGLERLYAREALSESELRFRQLTEHLHEVFYLADIDSQCVLYISPAYEHIWRRSTEALYAQMTDFIEAIHPEDRTQVYAMLEQHKRGESSTIEYRIIRPDGEIRHILDRAFPFRSNAQGGYRVAGIAEDITERKRAEAHLRRLALSIENAWDAIIGLDLEARITSWNPGASRLYGYEAHEALGQVAPALLMPDSMPEEYAYVLQRVHSPKQFLYESKRRTKTGEILDVEISCMPLCDEDGSLVGQLSITRDITERKRAEDALYQMNEVLEQRVAERTVALRAANTELAKATRLKDEFLASMSHELRTPLNAILGLSEALQEQVYGPLTEQQQQSLHRIEESGRHLLELITDILDLSKIEAGKVTLQMTTVNIEAICQASLRFICESASKKNLRVTSHIVQQVPTLLADERRLKQMLVNLLSNAVKFTPNGGSIGLEVTCHAGEQSVYFTVWDTGIGIAEADMPRLFQPFVQLDSSLARHHAGTGLGLSLVARLADLHGGRVALESAAGQGSRFSIVLPCHDARAVYGTVEQQETAALKRAVVIEDNPVHAAQDASDAPPALPASGPLLLLAEDNPANVVTVAEYLGAKGYRLAVAGNGTEALEYARTLHPALILMDIQMPGMDGLEATRRLRAETDPQVATIPIIALTALAMPGDRERCLAAGANAYITKPCRLKALQQAIEALLQT